MNKFTVMIENYKRALSDTNLNSDDIEALADVLLPNIDIQPKIPQIKLNTSLKVVVGNPKLSTEYLTMESRMRILYWVKKFGVL